MVSIKWKNGENKIDSQNRIVTLKMKKINGENKMVRINKMEEW
jgi:hypothetical protein